MFDADIVAGWVDDSGVAVIGDYYSSGESAPSPDTSVGGTDDIEALSGSRSGGATTLSFRRALVTGDQYDRPLNASGPTDMIYAWGNAGTFGLSYHGDNHNHIMVDFSRADGVPLNDFGREESGALSRELVSSAYFGTLSTIQTQAAGNPSVANYPYGSVADVADEEPSTGRPLMLLSALERNMINAEATPQVSLHVFTTPATAAELKRPALFDVMTKPRTTLLGELELVPDDELAAARAAYLRKHPESAAWIGFADFGLYRLVVKDVYVVGGFGNTHYIGWVGADQYLAHNATAFVERALDGAV